MRQVQVFGYQGKSRFKKRYILTYRDKDGCKAGELREIDLNLKIPEFDLYPKELMNTLTDEQKPILKTFTSSFFGQIIKVWYVIRIYVHHDALTELGKAGKKVKIPIKILPIPMQITSKEWNRPATWTPSEEKVKTLLSNEPYPQIADEVENYRQAVMISAPEFEQLMDNNDFYSSGVDDDIEEEKKGDEEEPDDGLEGLTELMSYS